LVVSVIVSAVSPRERDGLALTDWRGDTKGRNSKFAVTATRHSSQSGCSRFLRSRISVHLIASVARCLSCRADNAWEAFRGPGPKPSRSMAFNLFRVVSYE